MSWKKLFVVPMLAGVLVGGTVAIDDAYAVGQCTAHSGALTEGSIAQGIVRGTGAGVGAAVGAGLTAWTSNSLVTILGVGAGSVFGWEVSKPIGAAIKNALDKDEICVGKKCLQCDTDMGGSHHECENQTVISNGVDTFRCYASSNPAERDYWKKVTLPICADSPIKKGYGKKANYKVMIKDNQTNNGSVVEGMSGILRFSQHACYYVEEIVDTSVLCQDDSGKRTVVSGTVKDPYNCNGTTGKGPKMEHATHCRAVCGVDKPGAWSYGIVECEKGYTPTGSTKVGNGIFARCEKGGVGPGSTNDCLNRPTAEGRACCRAGGATTFKNNVCACVDTTKEWKYTEGQEYGQCVTKGSTEVVNPCDAICTNYVSIVVDNCAMQKVNNYANVITQITQQCANRANCNAGTVGQLVNQIEVAVASCTNQPVEPEKPQLNEQRLAAAVEALDKYRSGLDVSVWKDAEGNFNTARLVSDSIAGVVLGTAGGLITSSVVKKNQVKNGFEDVVCTIGGQTVGSYGDEISVGIQ